MNHGSWNDQSSFVNMGVSHGKIFARKCQDQAPIGHILANYKLRKITSIIMVAVEAVKRWASKSRYANRKTHCV